MRNNNTREIKFQRIDGNIRRSSLDVKENKEVKFGENYYPLTSRNPVTSKVEIVEDRSAKKVMFDSEVDRRLKKKIENSLEKYLENKSCYSDKSP